MKVATKTELREGKYRKPYTAPDYEPLGIGPKLSLLDNFSLVGGLDDWEIGEEALDLDPGN